MRPRHILHRQPESESVLPSIKDEVDRRLGFMASILGTAMLFVALSEGADEVQVTATLNIVVLAIPVALQLLLLIGSLALDLRLLRLLWVVYLVVLFPNFLLWFVVVPPGFRDWPPLWLLHLAALSYAFVLWHWRGAIAYGLVIASAPPLFSVLVWGYADEAIIGQAIFVAGNIAILFLVDLIQIQLTTMTTAARMAEASERSAILASEARLAQNALNRLVHDEVLSTLKAAQMGGVLDGQRDPESRGSALRDSVLQAQTAISELTNPRPALPIALGEFCELLADRADHLGARVRIVNRSQAKTHDVMIEHTVAIQLAGAFIEAVRNSLAHNPDAICEVLIVIAENLTITVTDGGSGFDLNLIPSDRLGIRDSILGRVTEISNVTVCIDSKVGVGTTVTFEMTVA